MEETEREKLKKAIQYLKIARSSDYVTFHAMVDGDSFVTDVLQPLEKICGWTEEDEKKTAELAKEFKEAAKDQPYQVKGDTIRRLLKIGGITAVIAGASGLGIATFLARKSNAKKK